MMKYNYVLILLFLFENNSLCTGINHEEKFENTYIIDVASEDLHYFIEKLDWYLNKAKTDFYIFLIEVGISFIFTYIIIIYILKKIDKFLLLAILIFISFKPVSNKWTDYKLGIKSAESAIYNFHLAMEKDAYQTFDPEEPEETNFKIEYIGDDIKKYGLHAVLCEIPGTRPSRGANPESFSHLIGGYCYNYISQRRYLDSNDPSYVGDEIAKKYRTIQPNYEKFFFK